MKTIVFLVITAAIINESSTTHCPISYRGVVKTSCVWYCSIWFFGCWQHRTRCVNVFGTLYREGCCPGWKGADCNTPICNPPCYNGGTCTSPNKCDCPYGHTGSSCKTETCSHLIPCFPGTCTQPSNCTCEPEFEGSNGNSPCDIFKASEKPVVMNSKTTFINIRRSNNIEQYRYIVDASSPNTTETEYLWSNKRRYNYINIFFEAFYDPPRVDYIPKYISGYEFGITQGKATLLLTKISRPDSKSTDPFISFNKTYGCGPNVNDANPETEVFQCNVTENNFDRQLEHGDNLTITVFASSGGYRRLENINNDQSYGTQYYKGQFSNKSMQLQFDFYTPYHCLENKTCVDKPFEVTDEISNSSITLRWSGWKDDMSHIDRYTWMIFKLAPNRYTSNLTEINPKSYLHKDEIFRGTNVEKLTVSLYPSYQPPESGMYSIVLGVSDTANNTRYARRLFLFDNTSEVSLNSDASKAIKVLSAPAETGYRWQSNLDLPIKVIWTGHFTNEFHVQNGLLNNVDSFPTQDYGDNVVMKIDPIFEDNEGKRSMKKITNVHGIVKFEYGFDQDHSGGEKVRDTPAHWYPVDNFLTESHAFNRSRSDGDTMRIWVKATDVMGNSNYDSVDVSFDSTIPDAENARFLANINSTKYPFSSRVILDAYDEESGIYEIKVRFMDNETRQVFREETVPGNKSDKTSLPRQEGSCTPTKECFYLYHELHVDNCWFVVPKNKLQNQVVLIEVVLYNQAMLTKRSQFTISNLKQLNGIDEYTGPQNLRVAKKLKNGVQLKWDISSSCYAQSEITVVLKTASGATTKPYKISPNADWYDIVDLDPDTNYTLTFVTHYGDEQSDPVSLAFVTNPHDPVAALSTGAAAGIGISVILIAILASLLIAMVVLWRKGKLNTTRRRIRNRITMYLSRREHHDRHSLFHNAGYDDDAYVYSYGQMEFKSKQTLEVPHADIALESIINTGRFADIYKAKRQNSHHNQESVVAKVLKSGYSSEDNLLMKAKINFYATEVGRNPNVLEFIGAVLDSESLGPFMLLEYCQVGTLKDWLVKQKSEVTEETTERFYRLTLGVCKGMEHLASKKIVHRHLAARNVLLNESLDVKVAGFGPSKAEANAQEEDSDERERIPLKWTAPECLKSLKKASSQSDVWSFGIVMWEIFSCGETPYPGMGSRDASDKVREGYRMEKPPYSSDFFYDLMKKCWENQPKARPTFKSLTKEINQLFNATPTDDYYYYREK